MARTGSATLAASATRSAVHDGDGVVLPDDLVGYRLRRVHAGFVEAWRTFWAAEGLSLTPVQGGILMLIASQPGLTQTELARRLQIETPTLSEQVKRLVEAGLVEREALPGDRRASALVLSTEGEASVRLISDRIAAQEAAALAPLTEHERLVLSDLLGRVLAARGD